MTLKNNRAPLLSIIKLYASFHHHMWIQTGVTVRKRLSWVVTSVTLTFDLWPWPFAWTSLLSLVITPENFMMIRWWEHSQKGVTDGRTDRRTDGRTDRQTENTICRAAWSQLKIPGILRNIRFKMTLCSVLFSCCMVYRNAMYYFHMVLILTTIPWGVMPFFLSNTVELVIISVPINARINPQIGWHFYNTGIF